MSFKIRFIVVFIALLPFIGFSQKTDSLINPAIPIIAYSVAGLIGFSRIIENRHWATDVFAGALLGYACGTQVVNNYHRYARLVRTGGLKKKKKKGDFSFNLQYQHGAGVVPGLVYTF